MGPTLAQGGGAGAAPKGWGSRSAVGGDHEHRAGGCSSTGRLTASSAKERWPGRWRVPTTTSAACWESRTSARAAEPRTTS